MPSASSFQSRLKCHSFTATTPTITTTKSPAISATFSTTTIATAFSATTRSASAAIAASTFPAFSLAASALAAAAAAHWLEAGHANPAALDVRFSHCAVGGRSTALARDRV